MIDYSDTLYSLLSYLDQGKTAAHAVALSEALLKEAGFRALNERESWDLKPGDTAFVTREQTGLIAFRLGSKPVEETGFRVIGAHTDSPGFRLKPNPAYTRHGYKQFGLEVYGGPLLNSWIDRDLTVAGRVFLKSPSSAVPTARLVDLETPVCRIVQPAIHLNRNVNDKGLQLNKQDHLPPLVGLDDGTPFNTESLNRRLGEALDVNPEQIVSSTLELVDVQPPALVGLDKEFYSAARIDNLAGSHASLNALLEANTEPEVSQLIVLFDAEEVGSSTLAGAVSNFLSAVMERIAGTRENLLRALANSIQLSNDGAHAVHPNYPNLHEPRHMPQLNGGPVIKINANERYATTGVTRAYFKEMAARAGVPVQEFVVRTDMPCGSTIGPIVSTALGLRTVDIGIPMLSMHSIRETGGVKDQVMMVEALKQHLNG